MRSPAVSIARHLAANGFGAFGAQAGWSIHAGFEPAKPDTTITVFDTGGEEPDTDQRDRRPTLQVRVRGPSYDDAYTKLDDIAYFLANARPVVLDGTRYTGFSITSDIAGLGQDDNKRHQFTVNFRVPSTSPA
jgi:hypothetical protein